MVKKEKVPKSAMSFATSGQFEFLGEEEDRKFNMLAYSGGVIENHWYWGNLSINLEGLKFEKDEYPILMDHDTDKKLGISGKPVIDNGLRFIEGGNFKFVDTEYSEEFKKLAGQGWPYQASIYALPTKIKRLEEDEEMEVNGYTLKGPNATVWMEATYMESSVATFGYDRNTKTGMFSGDADVLYIEIEGKEEEQEIKTETTEVEKKMDLNTFKAENPELFVQLQKEVEQSVKDMFASEVTALTDKLQKQGEQILQFEKQEAIRSEKEVALEAKSIWAEKLSQSDIADRLHNKVKRQVSHEKFMVEGSLDIVAFSAAIDAEIADWEMLGVSATVLGMGTSTRTDSHDDKFVQDTDRRANNLLNLVK